LKKPSTNQVEGLCEKLPDIQVTEMLVEATEWEFRIERLEWDMDSVEAQEPAWIGQSC
jgi:hypothetical protein